MDDIGQKWMKISAALNASLMPFLSLESSVDENGSRSDDNGGVCDYRVSLYGD